jgi:hypothetical protein
VLHAVEAARQPQASTAAAERVPHLRRAAGLTSSHSFPKCFRIERAPTRYAVTQTSSPLGSSTSRCLYAGRCLIVYRSFVSAAATVLVLSCVSAMEASKALDPCRPAGIRLAWTALGSFDCRGWPFFLRERASLAFSPAGYNANYLAAACQWVITEIPEMPRIDFKTATDVLTQGPSVTLARIADRFGVQLATIARARIDTENRRPPPARWEAVIAEMSEQHADDLEVRARELRQLARKLRSAAQAS